MPCANNRIGGVTSAKIRETFRNRRGTNQTRRIKAFWLCYMDAECPKPAAAALRSMPTDDDIDLLLDLYGTIPKDPFEPCEWDSGVAWEELYHKTRNLFAMDYPQTFFCPITRDWPDRPETACAAPKRVAGHPEPALRQLREEPSEKQSKRFGGIVYPVCRRGLTGHALPALGAGGGPSVAFHPALAHEASEVCHGTIERHRA